MALSTHMHRHNGKPFNFMRLAKAATKGAENEAHTFKQWRQRRLKRRATRGKKRERRHQFRHQVGKLASGSF